MTEDPFEVFLGCIDKDEGAYTLNDMRAAWNAGAHNAAEIAVEQTNRIQAGTEVANEVLSSIEDKVKAKDEALEAARELIQLEQETLMEPDGTLGTQYESVLTMIGHALVQ